ncbi:MAG TPA: hypothetical protein VJB35_06695 [Candidatus Nanoarchaeia archaeon]|nr:hypothetical protein [Candidatus Nanoarchaeia archaeon]
MKRIILSQLLFATAVAIGIAVLIFVMPDFRANATQNNHLLFQDEENNFREIKEAYNRITPQQLARIKVVNIAEYSISGWVFRRPVVSELNDNNQEEFITDLKKIAMVAGGNCVIITQDLHICGQTIQFMHIDAIIAEDCVKREQPLKEKKL